MKRISLILLLVLSCLALNAAKWQTITNNSHVYDLMVKDGDIYFSSWGGVLRIGQPANSGVGFSSLEQKGIWTTADGLASNDVRNLEYINFSHSLWLGSNFDGISVVSPAGVQKINRELGLPSNKVTGIVEYGSKILVATSAGLAEFAYLENVNFPLMLHQYTNSSTNGGLLHDGIEAIAVSPENYLYLSSLRGINYVHLDSLSISGAWHRFSDFPGTSGRAAKLSLNDDKLLVVETNSVYLHSLDPWQSGWTTLGANDGIVGEVISNAAIDAQNGIWIAYGSWNENVLTFSRDIDTLFTHINQSGNVKHWVEKEAGLGDKSISKIVCAQGQVYLCSWGDGIFLLEDDAWSQYLPNSISFPNIRSIVTDASRAIWFGSGNLDHIPNKKNALGASRYKSGKWRAFNIANSGIHTDNILSIAVDSYNRKWFGTYDVSTGSPEGWAKGVSVLNEEDGSWTYYVRPILLGGTAVHIAKDQHDNMLVACYDDGVTVFDPNDTVLSNFIVKYSVNQRVIYSYHNGRQYFIGTDNDPGLVIWNHDSIPVTDGEHWLKPPPNELNNCEIYGVVSVQSPYEGLQHWIAASTGLFMWDEKSWYLYDTSVKRLKYNTSTGQWDNDLLYYVDEERLYGSERTTPTAIYLDPFNRIWIGSLDHGISMYDPVTERFTNYFQGNSPLLSNYITALGYDPVEGQLLVGTPDGLNTLRIGIAEKQDIKLDKLLIFPNPYYPDRESKVLQIANFPDDAFPGTGSKCRIYSSSGTLVVELTEDVANSNRFLWNGSSTSGKKCSSGVYFVVVTDPDGNKRSGKLVLLRG